MIHTKGEATRRNRRRRGVDLDITERRARAWRLRRAHASYDEIGQQLGVTAMQACNDVRAVLADFIAHQREDVAEVVEAESRRLDAMALALWPAVQKGNAEAVRAVVRIMERRARMLGLDAPTKHELTGAGGGPVRVQAALATMDLTALQARHADLVAQLRAMEPAEAPAAATAKTAETAETAATAYARELAERAGKNGNNGSGGGAA